MTRISLMFLALLALSAAWATELPITHVVLFSSGVGYFERAGTVNDATTVELSFKPEQINDLLKSMVLLDMDGGRIGAVTYGAKDPVSKTLQAFAVNITDNPSRALLLNRLRGAPAEVKTGGVLITGKIIGVETKKSLLEQEVMEREILSVLTDEGIKSVRLEDVTAVRLLDPRLNKEFQEALTVVASGLDNQRKPVAITFTGKGERRVLVGYLAETPLWKTAYRLVANEKEAVLQGWAVVENTGDADWTNVRLSLVSGRPVSFIQDLYTPIYVPRPLVKPEVIASLAPVAYNDDNTITDALDSTARSREAASTAFSHATPTPPSPAGVRPQLTMANARQMATGVTFRDSLQQAGNYNNQKAIAEQVRTSVISAAQATDLGQAFEYAITEPVTLPRQQSALLPIVTGNVNATRVSIYNPQVHAKFPLYGMRVKNTTGLHLMGGPITVYNDGVYAGDATIEDLQPNAQRLISYAIDLGVECERDEKESHSEILAFKVAKGVLYVTEKYRQRVDYTAKSTDGKARTLVIEHAFREGWDLVEPKKADEHTDTLYRFDVPVNATGVAKLPVVEEYTVSEGMRIVNLEAQTIVGYLKNGKMSPAVRDVMQRVVSMQSVLQEYRRKRMQHQQAIDTITIEQRRIRQNMGALDHSSGLYKRYVAKLNDQESYIEQLRRQIDALRGKEEAQRKELEAYVANLKLE